MDKGTLWIDVTDFLKWNGNFTGFQHIQYNMARHLLGSGLPVKFFVYDQAKRQFVQTDFNPDDYANDGMRGNNDGGAVSPGLRHRLLAAAKRRTPHRVKHLAKTVLGSRQTASVAAGSPFAADDRVVVLGGIWHGTFAADMATQKQRIGFKFYHVVHDMIPVVCPQYVVADLPGVFAAYKEIIFSIADGLMANSQSSKRDALAFMKQKGITPPPFLVFRLADAPDKLTPTPVKQLQNQPFILSLGTVEGRKNHALLYYVYKRAIRQGVDMPVLAITGRIGWLIDDIKYIIEHDPAVNQKIIFLQGVSNSQRAWLLANCQFSVWPSFYEGWGMPIAESLAYGKLCISSDTSSMPEAGLNFCEYLSPYDLDGWAKAIVKYLDPKQRALLERHIRENYVITSWTTMCGQLTDFIRR